MWSRPSWRLGPAYLAVVAAAANDIWAVTSLGTRQYALTWNGSAWSVAHTWRQAGHQVTGVNASALSPSDIWRLARWTAACRPAGPS